MRALAPITAQLAAMLPETDSEQLVRRGRRRTAAKRPRARAARTALRAPKLSTRWC